jgi:hypothetical protein
LNPATCRKLAELGWKEPRKRGNFWRRWRAPIPVPKIVSLVVATLRDTFGVVAAADIKITRGEFPPRKDERDHYVVGVIAGAQLLRKGYRYVIGAPCGHRHRDEADATACLEKLKRQRRTMAAAYQRHGQVFAVDRFGISLPMKWTAEELARINK